LVVQPDKGVEGALFIYLPTQVFAFE